MSFRTFNRRNPCPVCGADHSCAVNETGLYHCHHCTEEVPGWIFHGLSKLGFGMYSRIEETSSTWYHRAFDYLKGYVPGFAKSETAFVPPEASPETNVPQEDPDKSLKRWLSREASELRSLPGNSKAGRRWADELGLPDPMVFEKLQTQWLYHDDRNRGDVLCVPERDGQGKIIGYLRRYSSKCGDGRKMAVGRRGILIPHALTPGSMIHNTSPMHGDPFSPGPIYLVEGASDTLALLAMGRNVIGRPSADGGAEYIVEFLRRFPREWLQLVVVGENDGKPNGKWPGRSGAYRLAKRLADEFRVVVRVVFPPHEFKDVRDWFRAELKIARTKNLVHGAAAYAAASWDSHVSDQSFIESGNFFVDSVDKQWPDAPLRFSDLPSGEIKPAGSEDTESKTPRSLPILRGANGETIGEAIAAARQRGEIPPLHAVEETAQAALIEARADRDHFPCSCPHYAGFYHKVKKHPWFGDLRCQKRCCLGCRQWLDWWEMENASVRFHACEKADKQLYRIEGDGAKDWQALRWLISYYGESFLVFWASGKGLGKFVVFTTLKPSPRSRFALSTRLISRADALDELQIRLSRYFGQTRPISTSHDWKRISLDEKSKDSIFMGRVDSRAVEKIREIAETVNATPVPHLPRRSDGSLRRLWSFQRIEEWDDASRDHLFACLFCGEALPFRAQSSSKSYASDSTEDVDFVSFFG